MQVLVIGSGAAGLMAALGAAQAGARVQLVESSPVLGGTTALSGGVVWAPGFRRDHDDVRRSQQYLHALCKGDVDHALIDAYAAGAGEVLAWVERETPLGWVTLPYPDYHDHLDGASDDGHSFEPEPLRVSERTRQLLRSTLPWRGPLTHVEITSGVGDQALIDDRRRAGILTMGLGLVGGLLEAALDRGVEVRTSAEVTGVRREAGRVVGVELASGELVDGRVVLASGGFEGDVGLARSFLRFPDPVSVGAPGMTGIAVHVARQTGAQLRNMSEAWWCPAYPVGEEQSDDLPAYRLSLNERARPGSIVVDRRGRRFANEATNYNDFGRALHAFDPAEADWARRPAWLIFDGAYRSSYGIGGMGPTDPDLPAILRADTLEELAERIEVPAQVLAAELEQFNEAAARGVDIAFGRGGAAYDRYMGDPSAPHPNLGSIVEPPFYALELTPGLLGTKGGPRIDADGRVLQSDHAPIPGLYAAGNAAASPFGMAYPGAGGTIGPAMYFGFQAGQAAATDDVDQPRVATTSAVGASP